MADDNQTLVELTNVGRFGQYLAWGVRSSHPKARLGLEVFEFGCPNYCQLVLIFLKNYFLKFFIIMTTKLEAIDGPGVT